MAGPDRHRSGTGFFSPHAPASSTDQPTLNHILNRSFVAKRKVDDFYNFILNAEPTSNQKARSLLSQLYQSTHGIFDHLEAAKHWDNVQLARPLAANEMHAAESLAHEHAKYFIPTHRSRLMEFARLKIGTIFNISYPEFQCLPRILMEEMLEVAEEQNKKALQTEEELRKLLEAGGNVNPPETPT